MTTDRSLSSRSGIHLSSPKTVLLLTQFLPPETCAAANRVGAMVEALRDYDVRVMALKPSYPSPVLYDEFPLRDHDRAQPYEIERIFSFHPHKGGLLVRAFREHIMVLRLAARAGLEPADIVLTSSPSMFLGPVALVLARAKRAKFVWDIRDVTWSYARETSGLHPRALFVLRALEKYMLFVLRRADLVVGATSGVTKILVRSGLAPEKAITVSNGASQEMFDVPQKPGEGSSNSRPKVVYAGLFGRNHALGVLLDVARALPEADFVLAGDGPELPALKRRAGELGIKNVSFKGYLNKDDLLKVYADSDVLFAKVRSTPTLDATAVSCKLFEYMATGRPLVYAGGGVAIEFLESIGCALTVPPEAPGAIADAIRQLLRDPGLARSLGNRGREFVEQNYRRDKLMEGLAHELEERFGKASGYYESCHQG
jgi:colanic acid biosynthesis glycosyl transferase WcaI